MSTPSNETALYGFGGAIASALLVKHPSVRNVVASIFLGVLASFAGTAPVVEYFHYPVDMVPVVAAILGISGHIITLKIIYFVSSFKIPMPAIGGAGADGKKRE